MGTDLGKTYKKEKERKPKRKWMRIVGWSLLVISTITWFTGILVVPWLSLQTKTKLAWGGALVGVGEISFYGAIPFLGKDLVYLFRKYLNPLAWFRKRDRDETKSEEAT